MIKRQHQGSCGNQVKEKMGQTSKHAKQVWQTLQQEILASHRDLMKKYSLMKNPDSFYNHLKSRESDFHISDLTRSDYKVGHYGKLISFRLMFIENGRIYNERIFISTAKRCTRLISIDMMDTYSKHYVERLIERKSVGSVSELIQEINERRSVIGFSSFNDKHGTLRNEGALVAITRQMIQFSDLEYVSDSTEGRLIHKSCLVREQLSNKKRKVVDFILKEAECELFVLARRNLPTDIVEAKQAITATKPMLTHDCARPELFNLVCFEGFEEMKGKNSLVKKLVKTLQHYE